MQLNGRFLLVVGAMWVSVASAACTPGYMKASDLESKGQGPKDCEKSCQDLGMRMVAMVLVSNELPGCVCQPLFTAPGAPAAAAPVSQNGAADNGNAQNGAAAAVAGEVVIAAAASAARQEQLRQEQQQQQQHIVSK